MERSVKRLLRNGAFVFTAVLLIFAGVEAARREYVMAAAMAAAALALLVLDIAVTRQRVKGIAASVQTAGRPMDRPISRGKTSVPTTF